MSGPGHQNQAVVLGQLDHLAAELVDVRACLVNVAADARANLDDRCVHLRLDPLLEPQLAIGQHFCLDVRA